VSGRCSNCLRQGKSNKEIAQTLNIAEPTVKNHVHRLLEKLNVTTRAGRGARDGLFQPSPGSQHSRHRIEPFDLVRIQSIREPAHRSDLHRPVDGVGSTRVA
jgi:predicted ArsR family transcriptional regulator